MKTIAQIAAELQGYDPKALSVSGVNAFLSRLVVPVGDTESLGLFLALGRVLALDVVSPISVPPHDNSAMDGYAFDGALLAVVPGKTPLPAVTDTAESGSSRPPVPRPELTLRVCGTAFAGRAWSGELGALDCVKIMTGAIMPAGLELGHID